MLKSLAKLSNRLDTLGLTKEADLLDSIIVRFANLTSADSSIPTYTAATNFISDSLHDYSNNYKVIQDYNYDGQDFVPNMSFYIKLTPLESMKSKENYNKIFGGIKDTFLDYEGFKKSLDNFCILFTDSTNAPDDRCADMNDNGLMRIFIVDLQEQYNKGKVVNLVDEFFGHPQSTETIYHEITHYLNHIRSGVSAYGRSSGGIGKFEVDNPLYINNTEEIQARVMSVLSDPMIEFQEGPRNAIKQNDPRAYINFFLPQVRFWGQYNQENQLRIINRIHKDFLDKRETQKKLQKNLEPVTEIL